MEVEKDVDFALIIANGAKCADTMLRYYHQRASEVIVLDGAMHRFQTLEMHVDTLIGDFDNDSHDFSALTVKFPELKIFHIPEQDSTDFEKGIRYALSSGHQNIIVLWATGLRADHFITNCANLIRFDSTAGISIVDDYSIIYALPSKFKKWYPKKTIISLIPIQQVRQISSVNLKYPLNGLEMQLGIQNGNSNEVVEDGFVEINFEEGSLLMMECQDASICLANE